MTAAGGVRVLPEQLYWTLALSTAYPVAAATVHGVASRSAPRVQPALAPLTKPFTNASGTLPQAAEHVVAAPLTVAEPMVPEVHSLHVKSALVVPEAWK